MRPFTPLLAILCACSAQVSDLDDLQEDVDACDPRGRSERGTDLDLQFIGVSPHVNQSMFFAVTRGRERGVEGMAVIWGLDDPDLHLVIPKLLPDGPSELAFWADGNPVGRFDPINDDGDPIDHQWTRPICPDGKLTFSHSTPFQDVEGAVATGAVFEFVLPEELHRKPILDTFQMWFRVTELEDSDPDAELQTRAFFRWSPLVMPKTGELDAKQRDLSDEPFRVGGNVLGENGGAIDQLAFYNIEFVIDVDNSGGLTGDDFVCRYEAEQAPDDTVWRFTPDLSRCDAPRGFDPATFAP